MTKDDDDIVNVNSKSRKNKGNILKGTTLRVYRYLFRKGDPLGAHEVQRGLALSSVSVSQYHLRKLLDAGLVKLNEDGCFVVDKMIFENTIRIRKTLIHFQSMYLAFLATSLFALLTILRPQQFSPTYWFSLLIIAASVFIFSIETIKTLRYQI